jgi:excisionase family DNA binding protein
MTAPELLTTKEAAKYLGITAGTLHVWRSENRYSIPFIQWGRGRVRYRVEDLSAFLQRTLVRPRERKRTSRRKRAA